MNFQIEHTIEILAQTPRTVESLLGNLSDAWTTNDGTNESQWSSFDVIGHLIHGEITDWIPRVKIILKQREKVEFEPFDRFAQFRNSKGKTLSNLLDEFEVLRTQNLKSLRAMQITDEQLKFQGIHPELGKVTLEQLLATWAVHDLTHIRQITTELAKRYEENVGVWKEYLSILK